MVAFNFNWFGHDYEHGVMLLSDTLLAATEALNAKRDATKKDWAQYEADVAAGVIPAKEERDDETGAIIWDQSQFYEHDVKLVDEGLQSLRKAYVIALYHLWERVVRGWTEAPAKDKHDKLTKKLVARGINPPDRFGHVYHLNNVLKHDSENSGPQLLETWPELFRRPERLKDSVAKGDTRIMWQNTINISDAAMEEIFATMRASGPVAHIP